MSTPFYDLASLVLVPSGYKASKVYAQKPLTTDGQLTFSRASTATRVNASGLIETVASNVPRLDYLNSSCPRLLLEPQRTNLALYSEQFNNAAWTQNQLTVTANNLVSPDGYTNADTALETSSNAFHDLLQTISVTSGTTYTLSSFVKAAGRDYCYLFISDGATPVAVKYNLATGVVLGNALGSAVSSSIVNYGNGWYRCSLVYTAGATNPATIAISATNSPALSLSAYTGDITKGIAVYGAQVEAGAYPTSLINTTTAAVTRLADAASKTGISSLFGSAFTIFADVTKLEDAGPTRYLVAKGAGSTYQNFISFEKQSNGVLMVVTDGSATTVVSIASGTYAVGQRMKIAARCQNGSYALYINGVQIGVASTAFTPSISSLDLHYFDYYGNNATNQVLVFPSALTNAQLAELTSL